MKILPGPRSAIRARISLPTSKSLTNRALVAAAVAGGGVVRRPLDCEDTRLLAEALRAAGWRVAWEDDITIGPRTPAGEVELWLGNSGTGARLALALLAASPGTFVLDGSDRLRQRPMGPLVSSLEELGASLDHRDGLLPIRIHGHKLTGGALRMRPEVSSQFVSALLLAAPLMEEGLELTVDGVLPSRPYVSLTEEVLRSFGVAVVPDADRPRWRVAPGPARPSELTIEADWSAAAFFVAAVAAVGGSLTIDGVRRSSLQGDRAVCDAVSHAGVRVTALGNGVAFGGFVDRPITVDFRDTPDLFPALAVVAAAAPPGSRLTGLENLRLKESDRLEVMVSNLETLGARFERGDASLVATRPLRESTASPRAVVAADDHRIAMAMAVASLVCGPLELDDPECVQKSFPDFWQCWRQVVGGERGD
jgi:3-phosphoshikimate 1-carboxyvinyltransferase